MRYKPQHCRVIASTEGNLVLQRQRKKYRVPVALETERMAAAHRAHPLALQEQEQQQHPALPALASSPAQHAGQLSSGLQHQAALDPADHSMGQDMQDIQQQHETESLPAHQPFATYPSTAQQPLLPAELPALWGPTGPGSAAHTPSMQAQATSPALWPEHSRSSEDLSPPRAAQPVFLDHPAEHGWLSAGFRQHTRQSEVSSDGAAMQQQLHNPASPVLDCGLLNHLAPSLHFALAPGSGSLGAAALGPALAPVGQAHSEDAGAAAAAGAMMAGMHLQELGQGWVNGRVKHSRSRDGSEEERLEGPWGMMCEEAAAAAKACKLWWHSPGAMAAASALQQQQQQPCAV